MAYIMAVDVGTQKVKVLAGRVLENGRIELLSQGRADTEGGVEAGNVVDITRVSRAIEQARHDTETMGGVQVNSAAVNISGEHLVCIMSHGITAFPQQQRITRREIDEVICMARRIPLPANREIVLCIEKNFSIDGQEKLVNPLNMMGIRLEGWINIMTGLSVHTNSLRTCCQNNGIHVDDVVVGGLASAASVLVEDERKLGVLVLDIGEGTADYACYAKNCLETAGVVPVGSGLITHDLAVVLSVPLPDAEEIKRRHGSLKQDESETGETIRIRTLDGTQRSISRKLVRQVIEPRVDFILKEIRKKVEAKGVNLKDLGRGVVLTGGLARLPGVVEQAEAVFGCPVRRGEVKEELFEGSLELVQGSENAVAAGLLVMQKEALKRSQRGRERWYTRIWRRVAVFVMQFA